MLPLLLIVAIGTGAANSGEEPREPSTVTSTLLAILSPQQRAALPLEAGLETITAAFNPEQKAVGRAALERLKQGPPAPSAGTLREIVQASLLLGDAQNALAAAEAMRAVEPGLSSELTHGWALSQSGDYETAYARGIELQRGFPKLSEAERVQVQALIEFNRGRLNSARGALTPASRAEVNDGAVLAGQSTRPREPSERALHFMREAVAARRKGDLDDTLGLAREAMRADPKSPDAQKFYSLVVEDRARWESKRVATESAMIKSMETRSAGNLASAVAWAEKAAAIDPAPEVIEFRDRMRKRRTQGESARTVDVEKSKPGGPGGVPLAAGSLLLALGGLAWRKAGRDMALEWWEDAKRQAAMAAMILGVAGVGYGGAAMYGALSMTPALATAGGGALAPAIAIDGAAMAHGVGAAVMGAKLAGDGLSYAAADSPDASSSRPSAPANQGQSGSLPRGYTRHGLNQAISRDGGGVSPKAILDAIKNPLKVVRANGQTKYIGRDAGVVLDSNGKMITTWARGKAGFRNPPPGGE